MHAASPHLDGPTTMVKVKKNLSQWRGEFFCPKDRMSPLRAGFSTLQIAGCRAITGPVPSRHSSW